MSEQLHERYLEASANAWARRREADEELEAVFREGSLPSGLDGPLAGGLLLTTMGPGLDAYVSFATRIWMPWKGKIVDAETGEGRNVFSNGFRVPLALMWPSYRVARPLDAERFETFRFRTWDGPSETFPETKVFKIDYAHEQSPRFIIRSVLDELVEVGDGAYLGQALMQWRGEFRRAAWFELTNRPV